MTLLIKASLDCSVPLDYQDATKGVAKIALGRFNATSGTRKGSVFVNPGGPGGTGVDLATQAGDALQSFVRLVFLHEIRHILKH